MSVNEKGKIFVRVDLELKKRMQKQAIDLNILEQDWISLAMVHYADHIDNKEIDLDTNLIQQ